MKKKLTYLLTFTVLGTCLGGITLHAQAPAPGGAAAPAPAAPSQPSRPRIALVNIAKVLREYAKANYDGQIITKKRQEFVDKSRPWREQVATLGKQVQATPNPADREKIQRQIQQYTHQLEELEMEAQRVLPDMTDKTIVEVYQNIKSVITDIAVTNNLDLVMCYPDASTPEEDKKPAVAQLKLQSPALMPMYHRGMDITEVVIVTLNRRHPAPAMPVTNATPTPAPTGNITPASAPPKN